ncbi:MAG TPA: DUF2796 domain-containing protein [Marinagarivorans sp.]
MKSKLGFCVLIYGLLYGQPSVSQERPNPAAHTHGLASVTVVYDAGQLLIEMDTPAANLLGFEHKPQNAQQRQQVEQLNKNLQNPVTAFGLNPDCVIYSVDVAVPFSDAEYAHETHEHDDHHEHQHAADAHGDHQDVQLHYEWRCDSDGPPRITVNLFQQFTGFEEIEVQWIVAGKQGISTLSKNQPVLELAP